MGDKMKTKIKKETRHILFIICNCILAVTLIVGIPVLAVYKTFYEMPIIHNDLNDYTEGRYLNYAGGELISDFIPKYADLGEYKSIAFNYEDRRKKTF